MKNAKARLYSGDNWKTPDELYNKLNEIYKFDFDPCPFMADFNGLAVNWGKSNFVNPPYTRAIKEQFILKALQEQKKGNRSVLLLPVSTSTKIFHEIILPNAKKIEFLRGRVKFEHLDESGNFVKSKTGQFDSMIVIF